MSFAGDYLTIPQPFPALLLQPNPKKSENIFATDKDGTGWRRPAATLIASAFGVDKVFSREAMACYARSLACPVGINTGSNGHKKYRPPLSAFVCGKKS
jgi:hypothetical protein